MSNIMSNQDRLNLQQMINSNNVEDQTKIIREKKHSYIIRQEVKDLLFLKDKYKRLSKTNPNEFDQICISKCSFLFNNYTDIYNKIKNDNLNLNILEKFLDILKKIEDSELNQHEGSYLVGKYLKELYVDSAMRSQEKIDNREKKRKIQKKPPELQEKIISYKDFKKMNI